MTLDIQERVEEARGCGFRQPGGLYFVGDSIGAKCGKLPCPVDCCPTCGTGIRPARGWTWIEPGPIFSNWKCKGKTTAAEAAVWVAMGVPAVKFECHDDCILHVGNIPERGGLIWVGEKFYASPDDWMVEGARLGFSRRINMVPRDFVLGETWIFSAHRKVAFGPETVRPAIFHVWKPVRIEYVVKGTEPEGRLEKLQERGITLVRVQRKGEQIPLIEEDDDE